MIIPSGGSLQNYLKTTKLNIKWKQRQDDIIAKAKERDPKIADLLRTSQDMTKSNAIQGIDAKLKSGKKLSPQEMDYLREHSPELYKKAVEVTREREAYERELKQCKTKEAVQKLNMRYSQAFLNEVKTINGNANIPKAKKLELLDQITRRSMAIIDSHTTFIQSKEYAQLPSEDDEKENKKAKKKIKSKTSKDDEIRHFDDKLDKPTRPKNEQIENISFPTNSDSDSSATAESKKITTTEQSNVSTKIEQFTFSATRISSSVSHYKQTPSPKPTISVKA